MRPFLRDNLVFLVAILAVMLGVRYSLHGAVTPREVALDMGALLGATASGRMLASRRRRPAAASAEIVRWLE